MLKKLIVFTYEKIFLLKIPNVELWLIENTEKEIKGFKVIEYLYICLIY
jgi:hypothetical protein